MKHGVGTSDGVAADSCFLFISQMMLVKIIADLGFLLNISFDGFHVWFEALKGL